MEQNTLIPNNDSRTSGSKGFLLKNEENLAKTSKIRPKRDHQRRGANESDHESWIFGISVL